MMVKVLTPIVGILLILVAIQFLPDVLGATHETVTDQATVTGNVTTGAGVTTGAVTLFQPLYGDAATSVVSITSTLGSDNPIPASYVSTTQALTVSGLAQSQNRILTVVHEYDATGDATGLSPVLRMLPTLIVLGLLVIVVGASMAGFRGR